MHSKGNVDRYGAVAIAFHWVSALAIMAMLGTGFAANLAEGSEKAAILRAHVPLGILVLVLTLSRLVWRVFDIRPGDPGGMARWQVLGARAMHNVLYLAVIVMGASGIALIVLSGGATAIFTAADGRLPDFETLPPMAVHATVALVLAGLIILHVGAALHHAFIRRDGLLSRMGIGKGPASRASPD